MSLHATNCLVSTHSRSIMYAVFRMDHRNKKQQHKTVDSTSLIEICTVIQINFVTIESNA